MTSQTLSSHPHHDIRQDHALFYDHDIRQDHALFYAAQADYRFGRWLERNDLIVDNAIPDSCP
jgi:hypothetical protein